MVSIKKMFMFVIALLLGWFIGAILLIALMIGGGDTMKEYMCPHGSCFETPV